MMLTAARIKLIKSLKNKSVRLSEGLFVAEGVKVVVDLINNNFDIVNLYAEDNFLKSHAVLLNNTPFKSFSINKTQLERISHLSSPNKVLAICRLPNNTVCANDLMDKWSFMADGINDPGNLGTLIRIAHWFGIKNIICSQGSVDVFNPKTIQSTMGSLSAVKVVYASLPDLLSDLNGSLPVCGADMNGDSLFNSSPGKAGIIVMGSESHGISQDVSAYISQKISIPLPEGHQGPDSLNVAVSAGIIAAEWLRKGLL